MGEYTNPVSHEEHQKALAEITRLRGLLAGVNRHLLACSDCEQCFCESTPWVAGALSVMRDKQE